MAREIYVSFIVSYLYKTDVRSKEVKELAEAFDLYRKCVELNYPAHIVNKVFAAESNTSFESVVESYNWNINCYKAADIKTFVKKVESALVNGTKLTKPQIDAVLSMVPQDLQNAVACNNVEKLCELKGIAEKSAKRIIRALKKICKPASAKLGKSKEFVRVSLNNDLSSDELFKIDTINKTVSTFEEEAMRLGGKDAIIHVCSMIEDPGKNEGKIVRAEKLMDLWIDWVDNGIVVNGIRYRLVGHGTNGAKKCKEFAVKESIYDQMRMYTNAGTNPKWANTAAKDVAYKVGLHSVYHHAINIPFAPEDFCIFPTVETECVVDEAHQKLDGSCENKHNSTVSVKRTDGYFMISVSPKMKAVLYNRMIARGDDPEEADRILNEFCRDTAYYTYRADGAALKGLGDKCHDVQAYLKYRGVKKTPDGRDIDDIIFFVDDTVIKTPIGEGKAYETFKDWCDAVRPLLKLGTVVKTHEKCKKDISYQVTQSLCEASDEAIAGMAQHTIDKVNGLHTVAGASKLLGREWGEIMRLMPELGNVRSFKEKLENKIIEMVNEAFSGGILDDCYYNFVGPDGFFALDRWFGLEHTPWMKANQIHNPRLTFGKKYAMWRSPVMHPNSIRVVENVDMPEELKKFMKGKEYCTIVNSVDDIPLAMDMDFDGDHCNESDDEFVVQAAEETLKIWRWLVTWETPKPDKKPIGEEELKEYWKGLTHLNELGLTVFQLNALLNGLKKVKDKETGYTYIKRIPVSHRGVDFKKFAANVLVDASKHGGATIDEPEESAQGQYMVQPLAKTYKDAVDNKQIWYVKLYGDKSYFETKEAAKSFYNEIRYEVAKNEKGEIVLDDNGCVIKIDRFETDSALKHSLKEPVNNLDELADRKRLPELWRYKTLNKLYFLYSENIRRDTKIDDMPELKANAEGTSNGKFNYKNIMFDSSVCNRRGMTGLIRKGSLDVITINGEKMIPDQGLFDSIARRLDRDRAAWMADDEIKDKDNNSFEMNWRATALAEIEAFANVYGKTLKDAYDVITWWMFEHCDKTYLQMDGKLDFLRNKLWQAYRIIFGGMAVEAAKMNLGVEDDAE